MEKYTIEEFDKNKTKVLKYILYKKRTEQEVRNKFENTMEESLLDDIIENLKENSYINNENYIERALNEFLSINTYSIKEIKNKLYIKGIKNNLIDKAFEKYEEELNEYETKNAIKLIEKKKEKNSEEIIAFLYRKGYSSANIKKALSEIENND